LLSGSSARRRVEPDREDRQPLGPDREPGVAAVLAQRDQVGLVDRAPELAHQVARVLGRGVDGDEAVQVREDGRLEGAVVRPVERVEAGQALGGQDQAGAVLRPLGQDRLVVGAGVGVELVDQQRDRAAPRRRERRLGRHGQADQVEQRRADQGGRVLADRAPGGVDEHDPAGAQPLAGVDGRARLADHPTDGLAAGESLDLRCPRTSGGRICYEE
jgi:hypothetical protein